MKFQVFSEAVQRRKGRVVQKFFWHRMFWDLISEREVFHVHWPNSNFWISVYCNIERISGINGIIFIRSFISDWKPRKIFKFWLRFFLFWRYILVFLPCVFRVFLSFGFLILLNTFFAVLGFVTFFLARMFLTSGLNFLLKPIFFYFLHLWCALQHLEKANLNHLKTIQMIHLNPSIFLLYAHTTGK